MHYLSFVLRLPLGGTNDILSMVLDSSYDCILLLHLFSIPEFICGECHPVSIEVSAFACYAVGFRFESGGKRWMLSTVRCNDGRPSGAPTEMAITFGESSAKMVVVALRILSSSWKGFCVPVYPRWCKKSHQVKPSFIITHTYGNNLYIHIQYKYTTILHIFIFNF